MAQQREDGRGLSETRPVSLAVGELSGAGGSARFRCGNSCALAIIHGPSTAKASAERYDATTVSCSVHRASAVHTAGSGASRILALREKKLQAADDARLAALIRRCLMSVIEIERFPRSVVSVTVQVLQQDGSLDACCINAVMAALLNAAIPCRTTMFAASCGVLAAAQQQQQQLQPVVDLLRREEDPSNRDFAARGTFVFSHPDGGVIATSGVSFSSPSSAAAAAGATSSSVDIFNLLQQSAKSAGDFTLQVMRERCAASAAAAEVSLHAAADFGPQQPAAQQQQQKRQDYDDDDDDG
jgi:ribonuclease PH